MRFIEDTLQMRSRPFERAWGTKWPGCSHAKGGVGQPRDNGQAALADWEVREKGALKTAAAAHFSLVASLMVPLKVWGIRACGEGKEKGSGMGVPLGGRA